MPTGPRYHAKHIHFLAKIPQKYLALNIHIFANFWSISSKLCTFTIIDVINLFCLLKNIIFINVTLREKV